MRTRTTLAGLALGLSLGLAGCDGSVKWPGFDTPEPEQPVSGPPPAQPTDTSPIGEPDPVPPVDPVPTSPPDAPDTPATEPPTTDNDAPEAPTDQPTAPSEATPEEVDPPAEPPTDTSQETSEPSEPEETEPTPPEIEPEPEPTPTPPPPAPPAEPVFSYHAPGALLPGSGTGSPDRTVYAPDMVFPILNAAAYPQSMVWNFGGGIGGGDECDARNYAYPWRDNFCEKRSRRNGTPSCPVERVHLGQDIRVGDAAGCNAMRREYRNNARGIARYRVVAAEDGIISNIGRYTVTLRSGPRIYRYLHMNMRALQVSLGDTISAGQHIGYVSKDFGGTPTTFHLHFEIKVNTPDGGWEFVPPYTSLVESYARREQGPGEEIPRAVGVASTGPPIPEGFIITE
jgi:hypothetical protein